jgi:hypothetical protein
MHSPSVQISELTKKEIHFDSLPLKFVNAIPVNLPKDQSVLSFVYCAPVYQRWLKFLKFQLVAECVLILTDRELMFLSDERNSSWFLANRKESYGEVISHCPLSRLESFRIIEGEVPIVFMLQLNLTSREGKSVLNFDFDFNKQNAVVELLRKATST